MLAAVIISVILAIISVGLFIRICRMKKQFRLIKEELEATRDMSYNKQVSLDLFDKDLSEMAVQLNKNLDYQKQLKLEAEKVERNIRQSVSDIAHDLRTPLTVMKGNLQMLQMEEKLSRDGVRYLEVCSSKVDEMREMADDFFQLSVLESDLEEVELRRVDMTEALLRFLADQEAVIRAKGMEPQVEFPEKSIFVLADEQLLGRIFGNLLNNIFRHAGSDVFQICLEDNKDGECMVTFANEANEDEELNLEALFERTYRGSRSRSGGGAGLGLYIVKLLVQKQKGHVSAALKENMLAINVSLPLAK